MKSSTCRRAILLGVLFFSGVSVSGQGDGADGGQPVVPAPKPGEAKVKSLDIEAIKSSLDRALAYIRSQQDEKTGAVAFVSGKPETRHPGLTAMAVTALAKSPRPMSDAEKASIQKAVQWIVSLQKPDGAIFEKDHANYCTTTAVMMLAALGDPSHKALIEKALGYIERSQRTEANGFKPGDIYYGGVGYEDNGSPMADLSNTAFGLEAAHVGGLSKDSKFWTTAQVFLARTQNLSETNDQVWTDEKEGEVRPGQDGGAIYRPGNSKAGVEVLPDGRKVYRSYGSMSYSLLKSYIFCGLDKRDPKVKAVAKWCADHFAVEVNPGFAFSEKKNEGFQGLFYYYMSMAKALRALGEPMIIDKDGVKHDWKAELAAQVMSMQEKDGSFKNAKNTRWDEASPLLCTAMSAIVLEEILAAK